MIRTATQDDNVALLELTRQSPMMGTISLCIERGPDFFALLKMRGEHWTFVYEVEKKIVGCLSVSSSEMFVHRKRRLVYYLSDLKVDESHRRSHIAMDLLIHCKTFLTTRKANLIYCAVAGGNERMTGLLEGKMGIPKMTKVGKFKIYQMFPRIRKPALLDCIEIKETLSAEEMKLMLKFNKRYQLGKTRHYPFSTNYRYVKLIENCELLAIASIVNTSNVKQNVVVNAYWGLKMFMRALGAINKWIRLFPFPNIGEPVLMEYIDWWYVKDGREDALRNLIQAARHMAFEKKLHFLSIGFNEKDELNELLTGIPKIGFDADVYVTSLNYDQELIDQIKQGLVYEDWAVV